MAGIPADPLNGLTTRAKDWVTRAGGSFDPGLPFGTWDICADKTRRAGRRR